MMNRVNRRSLREWEPIDPGPEDLYGDSTVHGDLEFDTWNTESMSTKACVDNSLSVIEILNTETQGLLDAVTASSCLRDELMRVQQGQQDWKEKYTELKPYTRDLQARLKDSNALIENLRGQLKQYRAKAQSQSGPDTAQLAGQLEEQKVRVTQLSEELADSKQEVVHASAELHQLKLTLRQVESQKVRLQVDVESTALNLAALSETNDRLKAENGGLVKKSQEREKLIKKLQTEVRQKPPQILETTGVQQTQLKGPPPPAADTDPNTGGGRQDELQALRSRGLVKTLSMRDKKPVPSPRPISAAIYTAPDAGPHPDLQHYKERCDALAAKLAAYDQVTDQSKQEMSRLRLSLCSIEDDLRRERANNLQKATKLDELRANFDMVCVEYRELLDAYQNLQQQRPGAALDVDPFDIVQKDITERMDHMMAQILAAEEMLGFKDAEIRELGDYIRTSESKIQILQDQLEIATGRRGTMVDTGSSGSTGSM